MKLRQAWIAPLALAITAGAGGASASTDAATTDSGSSDGVAIVQAAVHGAGGSVIEHQLTFGELQACAQSPQAGQNLQEIGSAGPKDTPIDRNAWTVQTVLTCTQPPILPSVGPDTSVIVTGEDGAQELGPHSVLTGGPQGQLGTALISYDPFNQGPDYNRPPSANAGDHDATDDVLIQPGGIVLDVYDTGPLLHLSVSASQTTVTTGTAVDFSADVTGTSGQLDYTWNFGDGDPVSHAGAPAETFTTAGTYDVQALVTDPQGDVATGDVPITVNDAAGQPTPTAGATTQAGNGTTGGTSPTGPVHGSGGTPGARPGRSGLGSASTPSDGHTSRARTPARHGPAKHTVNRGHGDSSAAASSQATTPPAARAQTPATGTQTPATGTQASATGTQASATRAQAATSASTATPPTVTTTPAQPPRTPPRRPAPSHHATPAAPSGSDEIVHGRLIADVVAVPLDQSPLLPQPSVAVPPPVRPGVRASVVPGLGAALVIVLLLALGAGRELLTKRAAVPRAGL